MVLIICLRMWMRRPAGATTGKVVADPPPCRKSCVGKYRAKGGLPHAIPMMPHSRPLLP
jgi:hypothetical protein